MILTSHQPVYIPWLGLFHKIYLAEKYCILDTVQYQQYDFNNRNKIKTHTGPIWLTVPVETKGHTERVYRDIRIIDDRWNKKHFKSICFAYQKSPFFEQYVEGIEGFLVHKHYDFLCDLNADVLTFCLDALGLERPIVRASDYEFSGKKSELVLDMCVKLGADAFIFGALGAEYADRESFAEKEISIYFQDYHHPTYRQLHGEFEPYMSVIDLLFNEGKHSLEILLQKNPKKLDDFAAE
jgi:hypothetical protein